MHRAQALGFLLVSLALPACVRRAEPNSPVVTSRVDLPKSYRFAPSSITVRAGAAVTWTSSDNFTRSVRLLDDGGAVLPISPGDSARFAFTSPGLHRYDCSFHPHDMQGTVLVTSGPEGGAP